MDDISNDVKDYRKPKYDINPVFVNRWSKRSMTGEALPKDDIMSLFDAARWAPSSYNNQPWRFIYALKDTSEWDELFDLMIDFNKSWAKNASALIVIISKKYFDYNGKYSQTHAFDTGAAWMSLALQGSMKGLVVHGMQGFDYDKAKDILDIPDDHEVLAMAAVGYPAPKDALPEDLRKSEEPSSRKDFSEFVFEGKFSK
ncbi:MAG: nitroreductase family protein [Candidatus Woesearchaeota archaeon]